MVSYGYKMLTCTKGEEVQEPSLISVYPNISGATASDTQTHHIPTPTSRTYNSPPTDSGTQSEPIPTSTSPTDSSPPVESITQAEPRPTPTNLTDSTPPTTSSTQSNTIPQPTSPSTLHLPQRLALNQPPDFRMCYTICLRYR